MRDIDLAYAAGFIDGEGSIGIQKKHYCSKYWYLLRMQVAQVDRRQLDWLQNLFGFGTVIVGHTATDKRRQSWAYRTEHHDTKRICELLLPYAVLKRPQMELAIKAYNLWETSKPPKKKRGAPIQEFDYSEFEKLKDEFHRLNARAGSIYL